MLALLYRNENERLKHFGSYRKRDYFKRKLYHVVKKHRQFTLLSKLQFLKIDKLEFNLEINQ